MAKPSGEKPRKYVLNGGETCAAYRDASAYAGIGLLRHTTDGTLLFIDANAMRILGLDRKFADPSALQGRKISRLMAFTGRENPARSIPRPQGGGKSSRLEREVKLPSGEKRWLLYHAHPVKDPSAGGAVQVILRDITDRRNAEEALRRERDRFRKYLDIAGAIIIALDNRGVVTMINQKGCELLGLPEKEILGKNWFANFIPKPMRADVGKVYRALMAGKVALRKIHVNPVITGSGAESVIAWNNTILTDDRGGIVGTISSGVDISERLEIESALRDANERVEATLNAIPDMMFELDRDGRFLGFHAPFPEKLYAKPEEFLGKKTEDVLPKEASKEIMAAVREVVRTGGKRKAMYTLDFPEGVFHFEATVVPKGTPGSGGAARIIAMVHDITGLKRAEAMHIKAKQEAEFYLDLMSHDLTNFNQNILGNLELLERRAQLTDAERKYVGNCKRQVAKMDNLITKVRAFSAINHLGAETFRSMDLDRLIADAVKIVRGIHPEKTLHVSFTPEGNRFGLATELLESVFMNIIENAVKHSRSDEVRIEITLDPFRRNSRAFWSVRIADDGPGIPDGIKEKIFLRFSRIGEVKGSGLGLSLAKAIVDRFGGALRVEDRIAGSPEMGAAFIIEVPKG